MDFDPTYPEYARWFLVITFTSSLVGKLTTLASFARSLRSIFAISIAIARPLAGLVLIAEAVIVFLGLAGNELLLMGFLSGIGLLLAFTVVLTSTLVAKRGVECNCFGRGRGEISIYDVVRNLLMVGILAPAAVIYLSSAPVSGEGITIDSITAALSAAISLVIVLHVREIKMVVFARSGPGKDRERE